MLESASIIYEEECRGDFLVVEDLFYSDAVYAQGVDVDNRYEIREKGMRLGTFGGLEEVEQYLDMEEEGISDKGTWFV